MMKTLLSAALTFLILTLIGDSLVGTPPIVSDGPI